MTETISYKAIVKLIHPDFNPNIKDAGDKIRDARLWRADESILYKLGVQWGVIVPKNDNILHTTPNSIYTPPLSVKEITKKRSQDFKTKRYQDLVKAQQEAKEQIKVRENQQEHKESIDEYLWRVKNHIFQTGDVVYVRTRNQFFVVSRQTPLRVYFFIDGVERFSLKSNVMHVG